MGAGAAWEQLEVLDMTQEMLGKLAQWAKQRKYHVKPLEAEEDLRGRMRGWLESTRWGRAHLQTGQSGTA